jgi:hypothetical protein
VKKGKVGPDFDHRTTTSRDTWILRAPMDSLHHVHLSISSNDILIVVESVLAAVGKKGESGENRSRFGR